VESISGKNSNAKAQSTRRFEKKDFLKSNKLVNHSPTAIHSRLLLSNYIDRKTCIWSSNIIACVVHSQKDSWRWCKSWLGSPCCITRLRITRNSLTRLRLSIITMMTVTLRRPPTNSTSQPIKATIARYVIYPVKSCRMKCLRQ
jgi:hypothetical protein